MATKKKWGGAELGPIQGTYVNMHLENPSTNGGWRTRKPIIFHANTRGVGLFLFLSQGVIIIFVHIINATCLS